MFDFNYNESVGFVPYISVIKEKNAGSAEEIEKTQKAVEDLSETVAEQSESVAGNTEAIEALNDRIDEIPTFEPEVVSELPATGKTGTIYLVKDEGKDTYSEYLYANGAWEKLGTDVDLTDYVPKDEFDSTVENLAVKSEVEAELAEKANASEVYSKEEADQIFLKEHQDISNLATKEELSGAVENVANAIDQETIARLQGDEASLAAINAIAVALNSEVSARTSAEAELKAKDTELAAELELKANLDDVFSKAEAESAFTSEAEAREAGDSAAYAAINGVANLLNAEVDARMESVSAETIAREAAIAELRTEIENLPKFKILVLDELPAVGDSATLYLIRTGDESGNTYTEYVYANNAWEQIGTQTLDLSEYAKTADINAEFDNVNESINILSGVVENLGYEFDSVDEKLAGLADANATQDARIDALVSDYKKLKGIVGDIGGDVEYAVPDEGKLTDVLKKSGTVKIMEDVESATYTGGITSKNVTTLNTNGKTITFTGSTTNNACIMTRGSEQLTIVGKGTINANGRIAIEAYGADSVINLSGSTGFFGAEPTYITDRSGGELIFCYAGTINIYAGVFKHEGENKTFMLNCYDSNYRSGKAIINVMGGKFYDFDPANNAAEGEGTSFVPEGYESVHTTEEIDGVTHDVYTVKKSA